MGSPRLLSPAPQPTGSCRVSMWPCWFWPQRQAAHPWASYSPSLIPQCSMWLETTQGITCTRCSNTCLLLAWYPVRGQRKTNAISLLVPRLLLTTKWVSPQWQRLSRGASQVTGTIVKYTFFLITHRRAFWLFVSWFVSYLCSDH